LEYYTRVENRIILKEKIKGKYTSGEMGKKMKVQTLGEREDYYLVGRNRELEMFEQFLSSTGNNEKSIWNIYGTGGVGKSTLLDAFSRRAVARNAFLILADSRDFIHTGEDFCRFLLGQLGMPKSEDNSSVISQCLASLVTLARERKVILAIDTYEEMMDLDDWFLESFIKRIPPQVLVILAGRYKLKGKWLFSPAIRERMLRIPIEHLSRDETMNYLERCSIDNESRELIWQRCKGHPLALSLCTFSHQESQGELSMHNEEWFDELVTSWLREIPSQTMKEIVEAASMTRHFNQEILSYLVDKEIDDKLFSQITSLSFIRKARSGWVMHDLMKEAVQKQVQLRTPKLYSFYMERSVCFYADFILHATNKKDISWEVGEFFHYISKSLVRSISYRMHMIHRQQYYWEPMTESNMADAKAYLKKRYETGVTVDEKILNPETGMMDDISIHRDEILHAIKDLDFDALSKLKRQCVKLFRTMAGDTVGLSVIIPINQDTLSYLETDPFSGPYFSTLSVEERKMYSVPGYTEAGWFIRSIDVIDWSSQTTLAMEMLYEMYRYMCAGKILIASPPPNAHFYEAHLSFGFSIVPGVSHKNYDGVTPTPTFILDTRGGLLEKYLHMMLERLGISWKQQSVEEVEQIPEVLSKLSEREQEVVQCVLEGLPNRDTAERLFVSEVTVKKHLSSIYRKLEVKNRNELLMLLVRKNG
jgi:DNA-binding CsgD family transcriptional regulator